MAHCLRSTAPFEWREAPYDPLANPKAKDVMDRASDFRMREGFCVPIHTSDGYEAIVTMAGERVELSRTGAAGAASDGAVRLWQGRRSVHAEAVPGGAGLLTKREREVLQWTAAGKTSWEISQILGVAKSTITAHIKAAAAKSMRRTASPRVVVALRRGEISL